MKWLLIPVFMLVVFGLWSEAAERQFKHDCVYPPPWERADYCEE